MTMRYRCLIPVLVWSGLACLLVPPAPAQEAGLTPHAHFMSGKLYFTQKVYDKAEREFQLAVQGDSTQAEYRVLWANAMCEVARQTLADATGQRDPAARAKAIQQLATVYQTAADQYSKAAATDPKKQGEASADNRLHYWVDLHNQAVELFKLKKFETALEINKLMTYLDPREPRGFFGMARTMDQLGETKVGVILADQAKGLADERIAELGDCGQFVSKKRQKDCKDQIKNYEKFKLDVDNFTRAKYVALGQEALRLSQDEPNIDNKRKYLEETIMFFKKGLEQDPSLIGTRFDLGNTYYALAQTWDESGARDTSSAFPSYREAARIFLQLVGNDSTPADIINDARFNAGQALYSAANWSAAVPVLRGYIAVFPKEPATYNLVAQCLAELKRPAEAAAYTRMVGALLKGDQVPVNESITTARNLYGDSDMTKSLAEMGNPEEVRSVQERGTDETVITWIWWARTEARHYIKGVQVGVVKFPLEK